MLNSKPVHVDECSDTAIQTYMMLVDIRRVRNNIYVTTTTNITINACYFCKLLEKQIKNNVLTNLPFFFQENCDMNAETML